ncbi:DUF3617 family protein [Niveibacterium sp. SC-1]|uniref:DUF3617 domain-containing protein n=1 Tax=Niveibacterium sp. SC-1 TaxID=3135646 RepID=UPI00311E2B3B
MKAFAAAFCLASLSLASAPVLAVEGELWEITTSQKMAGMEIPAQTRQSCAPKGAQEKAFQPDQGNCTMQNVKRSGSRTSFSVSCDGGKLTGAGEIESTGPNANKGSLRMKGVMEGQPIDMTQTWSSKKLGSCDAMDVAAVTASAQKQAADATSQSCKAMGAAYYVQAFDKGGPCENERKAFCASMDATAKRLSTAAGYEKEQQNIAAIDGGMSFCGKGSSAAALQQACKDGVGTQNWDFVGNFCPDESKRLAATNCEGRSYTTVMRGPYGTICRKYAADRWNKGGGATASAGNQPPSGDALIKEGANALKGLLGF